MAKFIALDILLFVFMLVALIGTFYVLSKLLEGKRKEVKSENGQRTERGEESTKSN